MKFSIKDFFSKCDQIRSFLQIWSHLLKKSLMENFICFRSEPFSFHYSQIATPWISKKLFLKFLFFKGTPRP